MIKLRKKKWAANAETSESSSTPTMDSTSQQIMGTNSAEDQVQIAVPTPAVSGLWHSFITSPDAFLNPKDRLPNGRRSWKKIFQFRIGPYVLLALALLFGLVNLASARLPVIFPNDESVHIEMVTNALHQWQTGHFPLDSWFPFLSLGSPFFIHYQSTPSILTSLLAWVIGVPQAFGWSLYLLLALWPISVFIGARLLGWNRWTAACAAAMSPLLVNVVGYGFGHQAYLWRGNGIWSQLWGMWMLPLAWGFSWRAISQRRYIFGAVLSLAMIVSFHFLTAYLAGLTVVLWMILRPTRLVQRIKYGLIIGIGAVFATLWVTLPIFESAKWTAANEFNAGTIYSMSYGGRQVLTWLGEGALYDYGRFPIVTILLGIGLVTCIARFRRDERARALISVWLLSLVLYFGTPTFILGHLLNLLPGHSQLLFHRYIMGVQMAGLFIAAVGAVTLGKGVMALVGRLARIKVPTSTRRRAVIAGVMAMIRRLARAIVPTSTKRPIIVVISGLVAVAIFIVILWPAVNQVTQYDNSNTLAISYQQGADATQGAELQALVQRAQSLGGGRIFAGLPTTPAPWGFSFQVGEVPVYIYLANIGADAVGFSLRTYSLMTDPEAYFDISNLGDYEMFGIHYLIIPVGYTPPVKVHFIEQQGQYILDSVGTRGYVQVVDTIAPITENENDIGAQSAYLLQSNLPGLGIYPTVDFDGGVGATPTLQSPTDQNGSPGTVSSESDDLVEGQASATVHLNRQAVVMLKASFDPGWTVTVDGVAASTQMVAPALVGVEVPAGTHTIHFQYRTYSRYPELFAIALLTLICFGLWPRFGKRLVRRIRHDKSSTIE